jgi:hypothetical protein
MEKANFLEWYKKLFLSAIQHLSPEPGVVLFVDGHHSHMSLELLEVAREKGFYLPSTPPSGENSIIHKRHTSLPLTKLQEIGTLPPNTLLATLDVSSLYTNIPHEEGISACGEALTSRTVQEPPTHDIVALILKKNNFVFGDKHYLQVHGTAMGTRMAPSYANLFMSELEKSLLSRPATAKPSVWWRYIDDIQCTLYLSSGTTVRKNSKNLLKI